MPIYEFYCPDNNKIYSFFARSLAYSGVTPRCPDGDELPMQRQISDFAITGKAKENPELSAEGGDDPRLEAALAQMEREMTGLDTDNPDPKMLSRMMRRMAELTGEKIPGQMDEMMRRMEAGEEIERLEAEYADSFDALENGGALPEGATLKSRLLKMRRSVPIRDPKLYEMSEYAEPQGT
jgi:hypothetical protein